MTDLVDGDSHESSYFNLRHCACRESILGILSNINVASQLGTTALVDNVRGDFGISDDGCILLTRTDTCAVSRNGRINQMIVSYSSAQKKISIDLPWNPTLGGEPASP